jgi:hypothetical protein
VRGTSIRETGQLVRNLRESNYRLQKICDRAMLIPWMKDAHAQSKLLEIAAVINSHINGGTNAKVACKQIADVLGTF